LFNIHVFTYCPYLSFKKTLTPLHFLFCMFMPVRLHNSCSAWTLLSWRAACVRRWDRLVPLTLCLLIISAGCHLHSIKAHSFSLSLALSAAKASSLALCSRIISYASANASRSEYAVPNQAHVSGGKKGGNALISDYVWLEPGLWCFSVKCRGSVLPEHKWQTFKQRNTLACWIYRM